MWRTFLHRQFSRTRIALAHARSARQLTGVQGSVHRLCFFIMLKLMFFFNMFDMIYLSDNIETIGRRARSRGTRCARACVTIRQSFFRARARAQALFFILLMLLNLCAPPGTPTALGAGAPRAARSRAARAPVRVADGPAAARAVAAARAAAHIP